MKALETTQKALPCSSMSLLCPEHLGSRGVFLTVVGLMETRCAAVLWPSLRSQVPPSSSTTSPGVWRLPVLQHGLLMGQKLGSQMEGLSFPSSLGSKVSGKSSCGIQLHTHKSSPDWSVDTDPVMLAHFIGAASHLRLLVGEGSKRRVLLCEFFALKGCELLPVSLLKGMRVHRLMMRRSRQGVLVWFGAGRTNHSTVLCSFFWCRFAD